MCAKWERKWRYRDNQEVGLEAAILERKRNSSLVKRLRADNVTGLKHVTEAATFRSNPGGVEEHSVLQRSHTVRSDGAYGKDSAGISSDKVRENRTRRKSKVS